MTLLECAQQYSMPKTLEADILLLSLGHTSHLILVLTSMNSTVTNL